MSKKTSVGLTQEAEKAVMDFTRLERLVALIKLTETMSPKGGCPWCGVRTQPLGLNEKRTPEEHHVDCPAFTPDGKVR